MGSFLGLLTETPVRAGDVMVRTRQRAWRLLWVVRITLTQWEISIYLVLKRE